MSPPSCPGWSGWRRRARSTWRASSPTSSTSTASRRRCSGCAGARARAPWSCSTPSWRGGGRSPASRISRMIAVTYTGAGGPEVVTVGERPDPVPGDHEVLVRATHAGLNPADLAQRAGHYPAPSGSPKDIPGLEVSGRVVACGAAVTAWHEGDRVFGIVGGGGLADTVVAHERHVARVPDGLSDRDAAAAPEAFVTAHDAVFTRAGLRMGETLLVNGATGGVGTAGVQLGVAVGAHALANASGVDVVLELVGAQNLTGSLAALAPRGRVIIVGTGAGAETDVSLRT